MSLWSMVPLGMEEGSSEGSEKCGLVLFSRHVAFSDFHCDDRGTCRSA